jgi:hypothetical protein
MSAFTKTILASIRPMCNNRLSNYILPGLSSVLIGGDDAYGKVRLFESSRDTLEFITPHSHRFDFTAIVLAGEVENTLFVHSPSGAGDEWCRSTITQVCGKDGILNYSHERDADRTWWTKTVHTYGEEDTYSMQFHEIHSIKFSRGARVLMLEGPQVINHSIMIEPWVDGRVVPTFKVEKWMFNRGEAE